jgi:hypothetical protein
MLSHGPLPRSTGAPRLRASCVRAPATQVPGTPRILALSLNRPGSLLLAVCSDRVIRLFEVSKQRPPPAALHSADAVRRALASLSVRRIPDHPTNAMHRLHVHAVQC